MWTISYKGRYINGYCDRDECYVVELHRRFKSLRAAKCAITSATRVQQ